jgi:hypothetical protein
MGVFVEAGVESDVNLPGTGRIISRVGYGCADFATDGGVGQEGRNGDRIGVAEIANARLEVQFKVLRATCGMRYIAGFTFVIS